MKQKKCKVCKTAFTPSRPLQMVCGFDCSMAYARKKGQQKAKAEIREAKEKQKSRADRLKEAQAVINKYVRLRDRLHGCVSCDKPSSWQGQWHASHFRSVGAAPELRFNLWNIHKSCSVCNNWKSGNLSEYEPRLRAKIGNEKVDWLRSQNNTKKHTIEYLQRLKKIFNKKCNRLIKKYRL